MKTSPLTLLLALLLAFSLQVSWSSANAQAKKIERLVISGNKRIGTDAIRAVIKSKKGRQLNSARLRDDVRQVFKMGYFQDV